MKKEQGYKLLFPSVKCHYCSKSMTNLRKHCLIGSTDGKNENGCVSNEKHYLP